MTTLFDTNAYKEEAIEIRRYLHAHPEVSNQEFETSRYLKEQVEKLGLSIEDVGTTSFIAILDTGRPGKTVGLRTDIDALPIQESPANLKQEKVVISHNMTAMHACGHDAHMSILLTSMKHLVDLKDQLSGRVIFIFEQAEEIGGGIWEMVEYLEKFDFDVIYGNHVYSALETGKIIVNLDEVMSGATAVDITVKGQSGHGSRPDLAVSPIFAGAQILSNWAVAWVNQINVEEVMTLGIGEFHSGTAGNIIPSTAHISGTVRYFNVEEARRASKVLIDVAEATAKAHGCSITVNETMGNYFLDSVTNDEDFARLAQDSVVKLFGEETLVEDERWFASETFTQYSRLAPTVFTLVGIKNEQLGSGAVHHNEAFDVDEEGLVYGYGAMTQFTLDILMQD